MKKEFLRTAFLILCVFVVTVSAGVFYLGKDVIGVDANAENELVLLNEIEQLTMDEDGHNPAQDNIEKLRIQMQKETTGEQTAMIKQTAVLCLCFVICCLLFVFAYLYWKIIRPFEKMENYAQQIAGGDFSQSLEYERTNFFGAFTWAFDHMRKEIMTARKNEAQALSENKTIIAALSHDIKTPIASIRAYAEGLEANLDADYEKRERYLEVIMRKCDEVSRLVNDLVLHSLSELEKLEIKEQKISMKKVLQETLQDLEYPHILLEQPVPDVELVADGKRMSQVLLNILENAKKYAPDAKIRVWAMNTEARYEIHIRDYGDGILPEDMPFILQKFYRGKNVGDKPGSGLGLYIVSYIMERMGGGIELENHRDGLEVVVWMPVN